jgi:hypothetical protein
MDESSIAQFYTSEELEAAVTYGNVRAFYDPDYMTTAERAKALAYDPEFPKKCKSFRSLSKEHSRLFFSWTDGKSTTPRTSERILEKVPKAHFDSTVTFGTYKRASPAGVREQQQMQHEELKPPPQACTPPQPESIPRSRRRLVYQQDQPPPGTATSNDRFSPPIYHSPSELVDSPPTPEMKKIETIVDALTPRKIPSKRRRLLVRSLLDFGVETLDDLEGFTYEQLRSELSLHAFTGVQLKRLLLQARAFRKQHAVAQRRVDKSSTLEESSEDGDAYAEEYSAGASQAARRKRSSRRHSSLQRSARHHHSGTRAGGTSRRRGRVRQKQTYDASAEEMGSSSLSSAVDSRESPKPGGRRGFLWTAAGAILFGAAMAGVIHYGLNHYHAFGGGGAGGSGSGGEGGRESRKKTEEGN